MSSPSLEVSKIPLTKALSNLVWPQSWAGVWTRWTPQVPPILNCPMSLVGAIRVFLLPLTRSAPSASLSPASRQCSSPYCNCHSSFKTHYITQTEQIQHCQRAAISRSRTLLLQISNWYKILLSEPTFKMVKAQIPLGSLSATGEALTQLHVPSSGIALFIPFAAS